PVVSIDNMQVINRCLHDEDVTGGDGFDFQLVKTAVKVKLPGAYHYLITSFFFPPVRKRRTTLVPPILRPQILAARREPGEHVLVYQTAASNQALVPALQRLDAWQFRVYGMGREGREGNVTLCAFSETGFVEDLRTARAVIAGGGFSLMSEAVHLHVPMLSVPVEKQFEQELNARYLAKLGYGAWARALDADTIARFLDNAGAHARALAAYEPRDNAMLVACVDELMRDVAIDEPAPDRLEAEAMGKWFGKPLDGEFADDV
ncbi:MAG TPA: glycosyltransferase family protein, partial [Myxococcota bacterium]|nr:glycosyltransferase family protein [Myxococcota bacterium]